MLQTQTDTSTTTTTNTSTGVSTYVPAQKRTVKARAELTSSTLPKRALAFKTLNQDIPNNDFGLPQYYLRADLIPSDILDMDDAEKTDTVDMAAVELDYSQGFPVTPVGEPFWGCLPHEPVEAHRAFVAFLDLPCRADARGGPCLLY